MCYGLWWVCHCNYSALMVCKYKTDGFCLKISVFVDDNYCKKCNGNPKMPSVMPPLSSRIKNITLAGGRAVEAFVHGKKLVVNRTERIRRLNICKGCEYSSLKFRGDSGCKGCKKKNGKQEGRWCSQCGCWIKAKIKLATEDCPKGFWG